MIYVWDEIECEVTALDEAHPLDQSIDQLVADDGTRFDWEKVHVIDLPNGTRIVIEEDHRAHTAVLITTPEDS